MSYTGSDMTPKEKQQALLDEGVCSTPDEAAHFLVDCGEIDSSDHAELLSREEEERIYG